MIRGMKEEDLADVLKLEYSLFPKGAWTGPAFAYELSGNPFARLYVLEKNEKIIGYCDLWIMYEQAQIANLAVDQKWQGKGYGRLLMNHMIQEAEMAACETISLEVRISNEAALCLYRALGFLQVNVRRRYYEDGENAYLMVKPLGGVKV